MRPLVRSVPPKKSAGKKDSSATAGVSAVSDAVQRLQLLRQSLKELHVAVLTALELLDQAMAAWLAKPQKQQVAF